MGWADNFILAQPIISLLAFNLHKQRSYLINHECEQPCHHRIVTKREHSIFPTSCLLYNSRYSCNTWHIKQNKYQEAECHQRRKVRLSCTRIHFLYPSRQSRFISSIIATIKHSNSRDNRLFRYCTRKQRYGHFPIKAKRFKYRLYEFANASKV